MATRRLRSDLRSLQPLLRRKRVRRWRRRLRGLDNHLRPVRDADVLCMSFEQSIARIAEPLDPETIAAIRGRFELAAAQARADLIAAFGTPRIRRLLRDCDDIRGKRIARGGNRWTRDLRALNRRSARDLRAALRRLNAASSDAELHDIRILVKRNRYLAEASASVLGRRMRRRARRLERLQDLFGAHQDSVMLSSALAGLPDSTAAHSQTVALLLAAEAAERQRIRRALRA